MFFFAMYNDASIGPALMEKTECCATPAQKLVCLLVRGLYPAFV